MSINEQKSTRSSSGPETLKLAKPETFAVSPREELIPPGGRPSLYKPDYCEFVVKFCSQGFSLTAFAGKIGVCRDTISEWGRVHPEFSAAVKRAKAAAALRWEERNNRLADEGGPAGSNAVVIFNLKNFAPDDFREKQEVQHSVDAEAERRRRRHLEILEQWEREAQERRAKEEGF